MPLQRRLPKRGFTNIFRVDYQEVNVAALEKLSSSEITPGFLAEAGIIKGKNRLIKILGSGEITRAISVKAHAFSRSAVEKIEKSGGSVEIIATRKGVVSGRVTQAEKRTVSEEKNGRPEAQVESDNEVSPGNGVSDAGDQK